LQVILNVIDFQMPVKEAVVAPRIHHQWMPDNLIVEADIATDTKKALERRGHNVRERGVVGVAQAIVAEKGKTNGVADPRKPARAASE
jgi:gamma-glutamyltranspeptidase/glutathione hydrolase